MKYSYYPGCTLKNKAKALDDYARACALTLGFELEELDTWQCCGGVYPLGADEIATKLSSVRALNDAKEKGQDLIAVCSACYHVLKRVNDDMKNDADTQLRANNYLGLDNLIYEFARRMLEEQQKNERLRQELDRAKPKADYYDAFIHPESCTNIRATAKELKVPEKMFTAFLIRKRYLYRAPSGSLMPYAKAADDGLFFVKDYIAVNGHQGVYTLVTPKGKALFLSMLGEIA